MLQSLLRLACCLPAFRPAIGLNWTGHKTLITASVEVQNERQNLIGFLRRCSCVERENTCIATYQCCFPHAYTLPELLGAALELLAANSCRTFGYSTLFFSLRIHVLPCNFCHTSRDRGDSSLTHSYARDTSAPHGQERGKTLMSTTNVLEKTQPKERECH